MDCNPIVEVFSKINHLSEEARLDFASIIKFKPFPKNTLLLEFGKVATSLFFIQKGLARAYYNRDGVEVTYYFAIDQQFIGAVPSLFDGKPSLSAIQLIENSEVYTFSYKDFENCCSHHHDLETAARKLTSIVNLRDQERIESLRFYSAHERYNMVEKRHPGISNRCPLKYIASYIGTTQVSLSRIRAGIQKFIKIFII